MRKITNAVLAVSLAAVLAAGCSSGSVPAASKPPVSTSATVPAPAPAATTAAPAAAPQPPAVPVARCRKRLRRWLRGSVKDEIYSIEHSLSGFNQVSSSSIYAADTYLQAAALAAGLADDWPIPACADPAGDWAQFLGGITQSAAAAGTPPEVAAAGYMPQTAISDMQSADSSLGSLSAELKQTTHLNPFG
jgi:hypothetical protein